MMVENLVSKKGMGELTWLVVTSPAGEHILVEQAEQEEEEDDDQSRNSHTTSNSSQMSTAVESSSLLLDNHSLSLIDKRLSIEGGGADVNGELVRLRAQSAVLKGRMKLLKDVMVDFRLSELDRIEAQVCAGKDETLSWTLNKLDERYRHRRRRLRVRMQLQRAERRRRHGGLMKIVHREFHLRARELKMACIEERLEYLARVHIEMRRSNMDTLLGTEEMDVGLLPVTHYVRGRVNRPLFRGTESEIAHDVDQMRRIMETKRAVVPPPPPLLPPPSLPRVSARIKLDDEGDPILRHLFLIHPQTSQLTSPVAYRRSSPSSQSTQLPSLGSTIMPIVQDYNADMTKRIPIETNFVDDPRDVFGPTWQRGLPSPRSMPSPRLLRIAGEHQEHQQQQRKAVLRFSTSVFGRIRIEFFFYKSLSARPVEYSISRALRFLTWSSTSSEGAALLYGPVTGSEKCSWSGMVPSPYARSHFIILHVIRLGLIAWSTSCDLCRGRSDGYFQDSRGCEFGFGGRRAGCSPAIRRYVVCNLFHCP